MGFAEGKHEAVLCQNNQCNGITTNLASWRFAATSTLVVKRRGNVQHSRSF